MALDTANVDSTTPTRGRRRQVITTVVATLVILGVMRGLNEWEKRPPFTAADVAPALKIALVTTEAGQEDSLTPARTAVAAVSPDAPSLMQGVLVAVGDGRPVLAGRLELTDPGVEDRTGTYVLIVADRRTQSMSSHIYGVTGMGSGATKTSTGSDGRLGILFPLPGETWSPLGVPVDGGVTDKGTSIMWKGTESGPLTFTATFDPDMLGPVSPTKDLVFLLAHFSNGLDRFDWSVPVTPTVVS